MIILIENLVPYHYEILESIIVKHSSILPIPPNIPKTIILNIIYNKSFVDYIIEKYPTLIVITNTIKDRIKFDYYINCTYLPNVMPTITLNKRCYFINHSNLSTIKHPNFYYLTPLAGKGRYINCDMLPFMDEPRVPMDIPIYIIQGNINIHRRNYELLKVLLETTFDYDFKIKILGRGERLFGDKYNDKLIYKLDLPFVEYHKEFLEGYCLLPLITKKSNPQYYTNKITSSINYIKAYKLKAIVDKELQSIHNLENVYVYNDFLETFRKSLEDFYVSKTPEKLEKKEESTRRVTFKEHEDIQEAPHSYTPSIPLGISRKRVALVKYSEKYANLGDCLMTISLRDFLQKNDIIVDEYFDRTALTSNNKQMIINGFHCRINEPLPNRAMFIGMFTEAPMLQRLAKGQLIGCRCIYTLNQVRRVNGLRGIITCCSTNTIEPYNGERNGTLKLMHDELHVKYVNLSWQEQMRAAYEFLNLIKTKELIYTDRLHVALPCIALGTRVVLTKRQFKPERYSIFNIFKEFPGYGVVIESTSGLREAMRNTFINSFQVIRKEYGL